MNFKTIATIVAAFTAGEFIRTYWYEKQIETLKSEHAQENNSTFLSAYRSGWNAALANPTEIRRAHLKLTDFNEEHKL